jgi:lipopolysaccharide/colanic/teichoic acid biosynthesis glycosyltransferase
MLEGRVPTDQVRLTKAASVSAAALPPGFISSLDAASGRSAARPLFSHNRRTLRIALYGLLLTTDLLCIFGAFAFGWIVRQGDLEGYAWLRLALASTPLFILGTMHNGAYSLDALRNGMLGAKRAVAALIGSFAVLFVVCYFLKSGQDMSRLGVGVGLVTAVAAVMIARSYVGSWTRRNFGQDLTSTVIITDETFVAPGSQAVVIDALKVGIKPEPRNPIMVQRLVQLLVGADRVIVACPREVFSAWAAMLKGANVCGEVLADEVQSVGAVAVARFGDKTTLVVSSGPLSGQQRFVKRAFDLLLAVPLLLFIAPLLAAIALAIKIDSPGPVLFRQKRVGFGNRYFDMYKFRSMAQEATDPFATQLTRRDDVRITRVGKFIRRTSLDELPQLFNVLGGSMSLVGPRPHAIGATAGSSLYWHVDDRYGHRHMLKPGITGLAQIRGYRGTTYEPVDLTNRLQSDLEYMAGWSIWRDILILLKTVGVVIHPNAY